MLRSYFPGCNGSGRQCWPPDHILPALPQELLNVRNANPLFIGLLALALTAVPAFAQSSVATTVTVSVPEVLRLDITGSADFTLDPAALTAVPPRSSSMRRRRLRST